MYGEDATAPPPRREGDRYALIVSGFPALGKSRLTDSGRELPHLMIRSGDGQKVERAQSCTIESCGTGLEFPVYDIDSSRYKIGTQPDVATFMEVLDKASRVPNAIILVGAKWQFREAMQSAGIEYIRLYPKPTLKVPWLRRQESRLQRSQEAAYEAEENSKRAILRAARLKELAQALSGEDNAAKDDLLQQAEIYEEEAAHMSRTQQDQSTESARHHKLREDMDNYWDLWMEIKDGFPGERQGNKVVFGTADHLTIPGCIDGIMKRFALCDSSCENLKGRHLLSECFEFKQPMMEWCRDYDSLE